MIKNLTIILLLIISNTAFSQGEYNRFAVGLNGGLAFGSCDGNNGTPGMAAGATLKYSITNRFALRTGLNYSNFESENYHFKSISNPISFEMHGIFNAINFRKKNVETNGYRRIFSNLFIGLGAGVFTSNNSYSIPYSGQVSNITSSYLSACAGYKIKLTNVIDLNFEYNFKKTKTDLLDGYDPLAFSNKSIDYYGSGIIEILFNLGAGKENIEWTDHYDKLIRNLKPFADNGVSKNDYDALKKQVDDLKDTDADGVPDIKDKEINSITKLVDKNGVTLDSDGDNVPDYLDKCPLVLGTNDDGCNTITIEKHVAGEKIDLGIDGIQFEPGKAVIKPISYNVLNKVVRIMNENVELELAVEGHTDNIGNESANLSLSKARAAAVKKYLIDNNIDDYRIAVNGFGSRKPIASNKTPNGRMLNRRVDFILQ